MTRVHFLASNERLREGQTVTVACGAEVPNIAFVYLCDLERRATTEEVSGFRGECRKCLQAPQNGRMFYAVANGQELILEETA